jgi:hypothetical protein
MPLPAVTPPWMSLPAVPMHITKLLALEMLYRPVEFTGIGPLGWQGIVPRRAGKVAAITIDLLQENILDATCSPGRRTRCPTSSSSR